MEIGDTTTHIISKGRKTTEVVFKTFIGRMNGKPKFSSRTRHVINGLEKFKDLGIFKQSA